MNKFIIVAGLGLLLSTAGALGQQAPAGGQSTPGMGGSSVPAGTQNGRSMTSDEFNKLEDYAIQSRRLTAKNQGKTLDQLLAEDKAAATALAAKMPLACQVDKAMLAAEGPETVAGKTVHTKTYETACSNGMGYFLTERDSGSPSGITCLAADTLRQQDVKAGRKPGIFCKMPEIADARVLLTNVITRAGTPCTVTNYRWAGQSSAAHTEFDEVVCSDKKGYMLAIALPGSVAPVRVSTCHDSAMRGLPCKLSDNGGQIITIQTFKDALQKRGVACDAGDKDVRVIGRENVQKRFVVEFRCHQHPNGLVAYIPLGSNKAPFEALDCASAARRGVTCKLNAAK